jgi:hypothetical protein
MSALQKCAACGRAGDELGTCGSFATCPNQAVPVGPADVVLQCDRCEITRAISASRIIHGRSLQSPHACPLGEETCECKAIVLSVKPAQGKPARGEKQEG